MIDEMADKNDGMPELDDISQLGKKVTNKFTTWKISIQTRMQVLERSTRKIELDSSGKVLT